MDNTFSYGGAFPLVPGTLFKQSPYSFNQLYSNVPYSKIVDYDKLPEKFKNGNSKNIKNEFNNNGYRCDNFTNKHDGLHVIFSGCSYTFGSGLELEDTWAKKIYNKIKLNEKVCGYFNLGVNGTSIINQVTDLFKYFYTYGNPDIVFYSVPDLTRFYALDIQTNEIIDAFYDKQSQILINVLSYQYYLMLHQYCKSNKIKLISWTWFFSEDKNATDFKDSHIDTFDTYYSYDLKKMEKYVYDYVKSNPYEKNSLISMDGVHLGKAYHEYWADFIYKKYIELK
jgi:hypothetical protein